MGFDVFISYSTSDTEYAQAVCAGLEKRNLVCWIAPRDIPTGETWAEAISDGIKHACAFLLILSRKSNASRQVARELALAGDCDQQFFCLRVENVRPRKELVYYLINIQWQDAFTTPDEEALDILADRLRLKKAPKTRSYSGSQKAQSPRSKQHFHHRSECRSPGCPAWRNPPTSGR